MIEDLKGQLVKLDVKKTKIDEDINGIINKMWEEYELTPNNAEQYQKPENVTLTQKRVNSLRNEIRELGSVNVDSIEEYKNLKDRYDFMSEQRLDLENTMSKLRKVISDITFLSLLIVFSKSTLCSHIKSYLSFNVLYSSIESTFTLPNSLISTLKLFTFF